MHPTVAHPLQIDLSPYVVRPVNNVASFVTQRNADASEAVCPLSAPTISSFEQLYDLVIARESNCLLASAAVIYLNTPGLPFQLLLVWLTHALRLHSALIGFGTSSAKGSICPFKELLLEPSKERLKLLYRFVTHCNNIFRHD